MAYEIKESTLQKALRPFDVVLIKETGGIAYVQEVSVNEGQDDPKWQIGYSLTHLYKTGKSAWYKSNEIEYLCNLFVKIAEDACHPMGHNDVWVKKLMETPRDLSND